MQIRHDVVGRVHPDPRLEIPREEPRRRPRALSQPGRRQETAPAALQVTRARRHRETEILAALSRRGNSATANTARSATPPTGSHQRPRAAARFQGRKHHERQQAERAAQRLVASRAATPSPAAPSASQRSRRPPPATSASGAGNRSSRKTASRLWWPSGSDALGVPPQTASHRPGGRHQRRAARPAPGRRRVIAALVGNKSSAQPR